MHPIFYLGIIAIVMVIILTERTEMTMKSLVALILIAVLNAYAFGISLGARAPSVTSEPIINGQAYEI